MPCTKSKNLQPGNISNSRSRKKCFYSRILDQLTIHERPVNKTKQHHKRSKYIRSFYICPPPPPPPSTICNPQLQSTCHYIVNQYVKNMSCESDCVCMCMRMYVCLFIYVCKCVFEWAAAVLADRAFSRQPKNEKFSRQFK